MGNEDRIDPDDWYDNYNYLRGRTLLNWGCFGFELRGDKERSKTVGETTKQ